MSAVKVRLCLLPSDDIEFDIVQASALGGTKPLWKFRMPKEDARRLNAQLTEILQN
jgi:hypothetical protein